MEEIQKNAIERGFGKSDYLDRIRKEKTSLRK